MEIKSIEYLIVKVDWNRRTIYQALSFLFEDYGVHIPSPIIYFHRKRHTCAADTG